MAEGLWNELGNGDWQAFSAGSNPAGYVHPLAVAAMKEVGVDLTHARSKNLAEIQDQPFDLVVTVCDNAMKACPVFPGAKQILHWPFDDPAAAVGADEEKMPVFRSVRDQIRRRISEYLTED